MNNQFIVIVGVLVSVIANLGFAFDLIESYRVLGALGIIAVVVGIYLMLCLVNRDAAKEVKRLRDQRHRKDQAGE
jgi:cadmium resistance protein CadD (predicted permease)